MVLFSYALFDMDGHQVPQDLVKNVGETFESILKEVYLLLLPPFALRACVCVSTTLIS